MGYQPKVITLGKAFLFPSDVASLGPRGVGVTSEVWWTPDHPFKSSLTGISSKDLAQTYEKATGKALDTADPVHACAVRGGRRCAQALARIRRIRRRYSTAIVSTDFTPSSVT